MGGGGKEEKCIACVSRGEIVCSIKKRNISTLQEEHRSKDAKAREKEVEI